MLALVILGFRSKEKLNGIASPQCMVANARSFLLTTKSYKRVEHNPLVTPNSRLKQDLQGNLINELTRISSPAEGVITAEGFTSDPLTSLD